MERLPPPPAALLPPIAPIGHLQRPSYERTSDTQRVSYDRTSNPQKVSYDRTSDQKRDSYEQQHLANSSISDEQRASLIRSLSDRLTDFQQEDKHQVPSPPLRLHSHLRKQFEAGGGKASLGFGHLQQQQQGGGGGQAYPKAGKPLHGPI